MKLYRGDKIYNERTKPYYFRGNGLTAASFWGNSDPNNIERIVFFDTITKHIVHETEFDKAYYKATDFISFSRSKERAKLFCRGNKASKLFPAKDYTETRYVFDIDIDEGLLKKLGEGIFLFSYKCNLDLISSDSGDPLDLEIFKHVRQRHVDCDICHNTTPNHRFMLIDAVTLLKKHAYKKTLKKKLRMLQEMRDGWFYHWT